MKRSSVKIAIMVASIVACVGGAVWLWEEVLEDRIIPKRWGVVEEGLVYRSGQLHPALVAETLRDRGIDVIVDLNQQEHDNAAQRAEEDAAAALGIERSLYPLIGDGTGDIEQYAQALLRLNEARRSNQQVLVHCSAGTYRTGGVVAMQRVLVEGWSTDRARDEMMQYNWKPADSTLPRYLNEHMAALAARLVELGVIEHVPEPLPHFPE
jgi:protein tyrosine/serine phosphatase